MAVTSNLDPATTALSDWTLIKASTQDGTPVVLTPCYVSFEWAITTSATAPSDSFRSHILDPNMDRGFTLMNNERLWVRTARPREVAMLAVTK